MLSGFFFSKEYNSDREKKVILTTLTLITANNIWYWDQYQIKYIVPLADSSTEPHFLFGLAVTLTFGVRTWKFTGLMHEVLLKYQPRFEEIRRKITGKVRMKYNRNYWLCIFIEFHLVTLTFDLRTHKCIQLFYKSLSINWRNMRKIRWKMAEKPQNAESGKEIKEKKWARKKRQHNNRKVLRLCRQTLIYPKITEYEDCVLNVQTVVLTAIKVITSVEVWKRKGMKYPLPFDRENTILTSSQRLL